MGSLTDSYNKWNQLMGNNSSAGTNTNSGSNNNGAGGNTGTGNNVSGGTGSNTNTNSNTNKTEDNTHKNVGGLGGGLGYMGTKLVDGLVSNIEGIVDFASGSVAQLFGNEEKAKDIFENDWYNYNRADDKFNPGTGWKVAGDLTGVIGGAAPDILLGLGLAALGAPELLAVALSAGTSFASGSGRGLTEAVQTTGDLGQKEWAGGVGSGALAAGIELASAGFGHLAGGVFGKTTAEIGFETFESTSKKASQKVIGGVLSEAAEESGEGLGKRIAKALFSSQTGKELVGEMVSEGIEEGLESWLEPEIQQNTYNPNAPDATVNDVLYSAMLGSISGGLISGGKLTISSTVNTVRGGKISSDSTKMNNLMENAQVISTYESEKQTGSQVFEAVSKLYNEIQSSLNKNGGKTTVATMEKIGELEKMVTTAALTPSMINAAKGIANNAESMAESLNAFYKKNGQNINITAEMLTEGLVTDKGSQAFVRSVEDAMSKNTLLRNVVINNMLGRMEFDAQSLIDSIYGDTSISSIATQENINRLLSTADKATLNQLGAMLGINNWATLTPKELADKIRTFRDSGQAEKYANGVKAAQAAQKTQAYTNGMPGSVASLKQGVTRFKTANADFAIIREGDSFRLYDYETKHLTNAMSLKDMEALVARLNERAAEIDAESEMQRLDRELDDFAMENVPEYKKLTEAEKEAVRATLRSARVNGLSLDDQVLMGRIAAKSGMNIIVEPTIEGDHPAKYDGRNTIYINAKAPKTRLYSGILGHEVFHKMFKSTKIKKLFMQAWNNIDENKRQTVIDRYMKELKKYDNTLGEKIAITNEEVAAAYAEEVFNNPEVWSYVLSEEPSLKDRVIAFFKGSPKRYSFAPEMDGAAKRWIQEYKKIFDLVAKYNAGMNVVTNQVGVQSAEGRVQSAATQVPKSVIKRIGNIVPEGNGEESAEGRGQSAENKIVRLGKLADSDKKTATGTEKVQDSGERFAFKGYAEDGKGIYESNFPKGTPKSAKSQRILDYISNVWSKKPINLVISNGETSRTIKAQFDPTVSSSKDVATDATKIARGNRHGTSSEQRVTLDLADDYYQIASEAKYNYSKEEIGKTTDTHKDVKMWHYFVNDIYFAEYGEADYVPYTVTINVKEKNDGTFVYSYNAEKTKEPSTRRTIHADVNTRKGVNGELFVDSISQNAENSNTSGKNSSKDFDSGERFALSYKNDEAKIEKQKIRLKAEYETDTVFSEAGVKKRLAAIDGYKNLPAKDRSSIESRIWTELNESNGYDSRKWIALKWVAELTDRIANQQSEGVSRSEREIIFKQVNDTIEAMAQSGRKSVRASMEGELRAEIETKTKAQENAKINIRSEIYQSLKKITDTKTARFAAASDYKGRDFKGTLERLTKMDWRGKLNDTIVRREMGNINQWYETDNPMLKDFESKDLNTTPFQESIKHRLEVLSQGEGELSVEELEMLNDVLKYFTKLMSEYDMVYTEGKWQSGTDIVYKYRDTIEKQKKMKQPVIIKWLRNRLLSADFRAFGDPLSVMRLADMYEDGIFTRIYKDWQQGEIDAEAELLDIKSEYDAFMQDKNNKNYLAKANDEVVELHGVKINKLQLISYVMTLKRKGSWLGVAHEGVKFVDDKGKKISMVPIPPMNPGKDFNQKLEQAINTERELAERLLSAKDREYMAILERGFERAKSTKAQGDMQRLGFVNVVDGYYYPIRRAYTEHLSEFEAELVATDRYANASFNKKTIEDAKSALLITSADAVFNSHVKGVSRYMYLSPVIDSFNKLFKLKVLKTKPGPGADLSALYKLQGSTFSMQSLIEESDATWRQGEKVVGFDYLQNLMMDTMGKKNDKVGSDVVSFLRGQYVSFALGGNPKVMATQFSSMFASMSVLNPLSHLTGTFVSGKAAKDYSTVAKLRDSDYSLLKTMGVTDRINRFAGWFSQGMSFCDALVVRRCFAAAQAQVAQKGGPRIGSEENLVAAGKLLDKVILETQQNAFASRKTEAARRGSELYKTAMMFKSDAVTTFGRIVDAYGEMQYLKAQKKGAEGEGKKALNDKIKKTNKSFKRAVGAVVMSSAYMVLVGELFKHLYGKADKDETDEEKINRLKMEMIGNLIGGIPAVSTIVEGLTSSYDLESMEFSAVNDILKTLKQMWDLGGDLIDGKVDSKDAGKIAENLVYTLGQASGVPTRNLKNVAYGFVNLISGKAAYQWNDLTKSQSYAKDLSDAIESEDYDLAAVILELGFKDRVGSGLEDKSIAELVRLGNRGENIIPSGIGDKVTIDGEDRELSGAELKQIRSIYSEAVNMVNLIVESEIYQSFDDETRADAVRKVYSVYKNLAYDSVLSAGKDEETYLLSKIIDTEVLCLNKLAYLYPSDKDENGNTISGSKREKVVAAINSLDASDEEKLLMIATQGYTIKNGDVGGMSANNADSMLYNYIAGLDLSDEEKLKLYKYAGYTVENGEVSGSIAAKTSSTGTSSSSIYKLGSGGGIGGYKLGSGGGKLGSSSGLSSSNKIIRLGKISSFTN